MNHHRIDKPTLCTEDILWNSRTHCERILICGFIPALLITIIILASTGNFIAGPPSCETSVCLKEAAKIQLYVKNDVKPCDNIYRYVCTNYMKSIDEGEELSIEDLQKLQLMEVASESIHGKEHKMVKAAKRLFQACMKDSLQNEIDTVKDVLNKVGGWPLLEGDTWNDKYFKWLNVTFILRHLGYNYATFLELSIDKNPDEENRFIYKVTPAPSYEYSYGIFKFDNENIIKDIVELFRINNTDHVSRDIQDMISFWNELHKKLKIFRKDVLKRYAVEDYQKLCNSLSWLKFINVIGGYQAYIYRQEGAFFPSPENMNQWIEFINSQPKRVQANYMLWRVVAETFLYLVRGPQMGSIFVGRRKTYKEFCLVQTEKRFEISSLQVVVNRRYLPKEKKDKVRELIDNIKEGLINLMQNANWLNRDQKENVKFMIKSIYVVIGQQEDYFSNNVLDNLNTDMQGNTTGTFLSLVAQMRRNLVSNTFKQIHVPPADSFLTRWKTAFYDLAYIPEYHILYVPAAAARRFYFDERRPNYLNYGMLGYLIGYNLADAILRFSFNTAEENTNNLTGCLETHLDNIFDPRVWTYSHPPIGLKILQNTIAVRAAHAGYQTWLKKNNEDLPLTNLAYTPLQIFWISITSMFCQNNRKVDTVEEFAALNAQLSLASTKDVLTDFHCLFKSLIPPTSACPIFS